MLARTFLLVHVLALASSGPVEKKFNITIGYLTAVFGDMSCRKGTTISGAVTVALDEINNSADILADVKILLDYRDTRSTTSVNLVTDMAAKNVVAFFGPEGICYSEAIVAHTKNIPMFSYKCPDEEVTKLSNFVKLDPPSDQAMKSVISLLQYYRWNHFGLLLERPWVKEAQVLQAYAMVKRMTVGFVRTLEPSTGKDWDVYRLRNVVKETKQFARIYVYLGSYDGLVNIMEAMDSEKLFAHGEYMVIFVDLTEYMMRNSLQYLTEPDAMKLYSCPDFPPAFQARARSLLVVVTSPPAPSFDEFADRVREMDREDPFDFPEILNRFFYKKFISVHAAYLYDSIKMYAMALDDLIKQDTQTEKLTYDKLMRIVTNASQIVSKVVMSSPYQSILGSPLYLDAGGVSKGHFSLLAFKPMIFQEAKNNCSHTMVPVGHFEFGDGIYPTYKLNPRMPIDWPDSVKPDDGPSCGYENCPY